MHKLLYMVRYICPPRWLTASGGYGANMLSGRLGLPQNCTRQKKVQLSKLSFDHFIKAKLILHSGGERFYGGI
jgi:hypothetical protein